MPGASDALELTLIGLPGMRWRGAEIALPPAKVFAVLAYLAMRDEPCPRRNLSEQLWGTTKSSSLRVALSELRGLPGADAWLVAEGQLLSLRATTDVAAFEEAIHEEDYRRAVEVWQAGESREKTFLAGLEPRRAEAFMQWLEAERSRLNELYLSAVRGYLGELEEAEQVAEAIGLARRLLDEDSLNEDVHRTLIRLEHRRGNTEAALAQFATLQELLHEELGVDPLEETLALMREIESGGVSARQNAVLTRDPRAVPSLPDRLIGRDALLDEVAARLEPQGRLLLHGLGGAGKSALAATFARRWLEANDRPLLWLHAGDDPPDVLFDAVARVFDAQQSLNQARDKTGFLRGLLGGVGLLVLDDAWNSYAVGKLTDALPPTVPLLVTARQRFPRFERLDVGQLGRGDALELLGHHAGHPVSDDDHADRLCGLLGDHAFAVRIAGLSLAVDGLEPRELVARVEGIPHALKVPEAFAEDGRESVASLLGASVEALGDFAYETLMAFGAMFTSSATPELLALSTHRDEDTTEAALIELHRRGLADRQAEAGSDGVTYRLHDLVYSFANANSHVRKSTVAAACRAFLELHRHDFDVLDAEISNVLGGVEVSRARGKTFFVDMMKDLVVGDAYYQARGHSRRSVTLLRSAIQEAKRRDRLEDAHHMLSRLGNTYRELFADFDQALTAYLDALELARQLGDGGREAILTSVIAAVRFHQGADDVAVYTERAFQLARSVGDDLVLCHVLQNAGYIAGHREDWRAMSRLSREALEVTSRLESDVRVDQSEVAAKQFFATINLAESERRLSNLRTALEICKRGLEIAEGFDNRVWMAYAFHEMGHVRHALTMRAEARANYGKALRLYLDNNAVAEHEQLLRFMMESGYEEVDLSPGASFGRQNERPSQT